MENTNDDFYVHLLLLIWGLNFITVKIQGTPVSLELSLTYCLILAAVLFSLLVWIMKPKGKPSKEDLSYILVFGISGYMLALFPAIGGITSVTIHESDPSMYLVIGCLSSCIGAAIALGLGTYYRKSMLNEKKFTHIKLE